MTITLSQNHLINKQYQQAANIYEQAIETEPENISNYWHLGLVYLLQGQETEAQMTWFMVMSQGTPEEVEKWTEELVEIVTQEALRQAENEPQTAWLLRQHVREIQPDNLDNLLNLVNLALSLDLWEGGQQNLAHIVSLINSNPKQKINTSLLLAVLQKLLGNYPLHPQTFELASAWVNPRISGKEQQAINQLLITKAYQFAPQLPGEIAAKFTELCLKLEPQNLGLLANLTNLYQNIGKYQDSVTYGKRFLGCAEKIEDKIAAHYLIVRGLMEGGGHWEEAQKHYDKYQQKLLKLIKNNSPLSLNHLHNLISTVALGNYFADSPQANHEFRNQVAQYWQNQIENKYSCVKQTKVEEKKHKKLKIGYISNFFYQHSIGWLARWLFIYHDTNNVEIYAYSLNGIQDKVQQTIASHTHKFRNLANNHNIAEIAQLIAQDGIDILVDLDSVTDNIVSSVMALKPAPIQITWLGSDASGVPTIDYFLVDEHVLTSYAQEYYAAKIWRLPNCYIAVDGFEIGVPTLRREQLNIPSNAIIYLSAQSAYKRHPHTAKLQMKIIKAVPNSYFLIKGAGDGEAIKNFFTQIALEEGVDPQRLRFLPRDSSEEIHRANLAIADVVLDTFPYNGATTTLETLWMGIPLVTRVGEQFSARNSYTMMVNAGITEGIAKSDEEYLEWGITLGKDAELREKVTGTLIKYRRKSPLWNGEQFTRNLEIAYQQMWTDYLKAKPNNNNSFSATESLQLQIETKSLSIQLQEQNQQAETGVTWLASYPKSGNTWVRFLLFNLLCGKPNHTIQIENQIPDLHCCLSGENNLSFPDLVSQERAIIKSHFLPQVLQQEKINPLFTKTTSCIYIVRNPLDVMLSNLNYRVLQAYNQISSSDISLFADNYLNQFIANQGDIEWQKFGFGSWIEHVNNWLAWGENNSFLIIRYEDLLSDTLTELQKICQFLQLEKSEIELQQAVFDSSFSTLKKLEDKEINNQEEGLFYHSSYQVAHQAGLRFINQGKAGQGKSKLSPTQVKLAQQQFASLMEKLGYSTTN